ncbi:MAG: hypothetical protein AAF191_21125, partial [Verrucomicrobiota bacterium]
MNPIVIIVRWITAAALLSCSGQALGQVYGEVHLKNGTVRKGQLSGVDENGTKLLVQGGAGTVITFAHRQVAKVVFPAPPGITQPRRNSASRNVTNEPR